MTDNQERKSCQQDFLPRRRVNVNVPVPQNVQFGTVDPQTGTWELTDKSLGAGVAVGPNGAQILTAKPSTVSSPARQKLFLSCMACLQIA